MSSSSSSSRTKKYAAAVVVAIDDSPEETVAQELYPASHIADLQFYHHDDDGCGGDDEQQYFEQQQQLTSLSPSFQFSTLLKRQDGIDLYGRTISYSDQEEAKYATLTIRPLPTNTTEQANHDFREEDNDNDFNLWDVTMLLTPPPPPEKNHLPVSLSNQKCFIAMNRFTVKEDCQLLFEQRWMERESKLSMQSGFVAFSLLRRRRQKRNDDDKKKKKFNYSTCTIWSSKETWVQWRTGQGKYSHDASRTMKRTPISEWLQEPASPIFWNGWNTNIIMTTTSTIKDDGGVSKE